MRLFRIVNYVKEYEYRLHIAARAGDELAQEKWKAVKQRDEEREHYAPPIKVWPWMKGAA